MPFDADAPFALDAAGRRRLLVAAADVIVAHADELTALDSAIGDGDHGFNMKRGFEAVTASRDDFAALSLPEMLKAVGMKLVTTIGGASGPLYGTLLMALGKAMPEAPTRRQAVEAFAKALEAVKARGKSDVGQKTMLDVLAPTLAALESGAEAAEIAAIAFAAAQATAPLRAIRGRASFLGERSVGHVDPGARSSSLMIAALCEAWSVGT